MFGKKDKKGTAGESLTDAGGVSFAGAKGSETVSADVHEDITAAEGGHTASDGAVRDADGAIVESDVSGDVDAEVISEPQSMEALKAANRGKPKKGKTPKAMKEPKPKKERAPKSGGFFARFAKSGDPMGGSNGADDSIGDEEPSLPVMVIIDYYRGMTKEREAEQLVRATIEKNFDAPNASYFYIQKFKDGLAVEMQEGGGRAYLPEILAKLEEDPTAVCAAPMSNRVAQVRLDPDTKALETLILVANQLPADNVFTALPTLPMRTFDRRGSRVFLAGIGLLAASTMALMFSVGSFFIDTEAWALPYVAQTAAKDLPMAQVPQIESALSAGADCIYKMEFAGGSWTITPGYDNAGTCGLNPASPVIEGEDLLDGEVMTSDGAAGPPVDAGAPPGAAPVAPPPAIFGPPAGAPGN